MNPFTLFERATVLVSLRGMLAVRLELATLAALIAKAPEPAALQHEHEVFDWASRLRRSIASGERPVRLAAFGELARVVFGEAERQGPDTMPVACLQLLAAVVRYVDSAGPGLVAAVVHAVACEACAWHPSIPRAGDPEHGGGA